MIFFLHLLPGSALMLAIAPFGRNSDRAKNFPDEELIRKIAAGNETAFELFYERYKGLVYSLSLRMLDDRGTAEEVTLDAFNKIWNQAADFRPDRAAVKTWLISIARNRAIDVLRMRSGRWDQNPTQWADGELETLPDSSDPEQEVTKLDMRHKVQAAIAELPEEQRDVLSLAYFKGLSHSQIATALNQPLGTVKGRIRTAMLHLQKRFKQKS